METKATKMQIDLPALMKQIARECGSFPTAIGLQIAAKHLRTISERAVQLNDPVLIDALTELGLVEKPK